MVQHAVILSGGAGTRLWPASIKKCPKQFLDLGGLGGGRSLFMMTALRALSLGLSGFLIIVTHKDHLKEIENQCSLIIEREPSLSYRILVLPEPEAKNTAPAIAYVCSVLKAIGEDESILLVLPSDHIIDPLDAFAHDVGRAFRLAEKGYLVTFGIPPKRPETGFGYIEVGSALDEGFKVKKFKEKPDSKTAARFLEHGSHYWNSGMFAYRVDTFIEELNSYTPEVAQPFTGLDLKAELNKTDKVNIFSIPEVLFRAYGKAPAVSLDYAIMEKSTNCAMVSTSFNWSDIGSWDEVSRLSKGEGEGKGEGRENVFSVASEGNFVYSDMPVALAGVDNLLVVVKNGVVLISKKGRSQMVRDIVREVRSRGHEEIL